MDGDNILTFHWNSIIWKGIELHGIRGRRMYEDWYKMSSLLQSGLNIRPIITHRFPVTEFDQAFQLRASGTSGKVILDWT